MSGKMFRIALRLKIDSTSSYEKKTTTVNLKFIKYLYLIGKNSQLSVESKLLLYNNSKAFGHMVSNLGV